MLDDDDNTLDSLLEESLDRKKSKKIAKDKEKLGSQWVNDATKKALQKKIHKAEVKVDWKPIAAIAMFHEQVCMNCGTRHRHFQGFFQHQQHKWQQHSFKYVPASDHTMTDGLPHFTKIVAHISDICAKCIDTTDWLDENLYLTEHETPHIGSWTEHKQHKKLVDDNAGQGYEYAVRTSPSESERFKND